MSDMAAEFFEIRDELNKALRERDEARRDAASRMGECLKRGKELDEALESNLEWQGVHTVLKMEYQDVVVERDLLREALVAARDALYATGYRMDSLGLEIERALKVAEVKP